MDSFEQFKGLNARNQPMEKNTEVNRALNQMGPEEKKVALHEEIKRMNKLPANSTYAIHRLRVLNKILHLLSIQRTTSEESELELLFAKLSI